MTRGVLAESHYVHPEVDRAKLRLLLAFDARPFDALAHAQAAQDLARLLTLRHPRHERHPNQRCDYYYRGREECRQSSTSSSSPE